MKTKLDEKLLSNYSNEDLINYLKIYLNIDNINNKIVDVNNLNSFYKTTADIFIDNLKLPVQSIYYNFYKILTDAKSLILVDNDNKNLLDYNNMISYFENENPDSEFKRFLKVYEDIFVQAEFTDAEDIYLIDNNKIVLWIEEYGYFIILLKSQNAKQELEKNMLLLQYCYNYFEQSLKRIKIYSEMEKMNQFLSENIDRIGEFELMSRYILSAKDIDILLKRFYSFLTKKSFNFNSIFILTSVDNISNNYDLYSYVNETAFVKNNFNPLNYKTISEYDASFLNDNYLKVFQNLILNDDLTYDESVLSNNHIYYLSNDKSVIVVLFYENNQKGNINFNLEKLNFLMCNFDITFRKLLYYKKITELSKKDGLTGLYNHSYLQKKLKYIISDLQNGKLDSEVIAIFLDLDDFKIINDKFGHIFGDDILRKVANLLLDIFPNDSFVTRYGGDEFVILLFNYSLENIEYVLNNKFFTQLSEISKNIDGINLGVSLGIAKLNSDIDISNDIVLDRIDKAMYKAKESGKNKFVYA
jgi:diguanylate cyclase (GGDEF)-like protein